MKKLIITVATALAALSATVSCSFFELDNFDGPNAEVTGNLIDMVTGEKMSLEASMSQSFSWTTWSMVTAVDYGAIVVYEQGYVPPTWEGNPEDYPGKDSGQNWMVRFDGQFTNTMVFAGTYKYTLQTKLPCYNPESGKDIFVLKEGKNRMDIGVLPFCRVKDPKISYDASSKKMIATFYVELGDPSRANKISNVIFSGNTQLFVGGNNMNLAKDHKPAKAQNVNPGELITLEIDTTAPENANLFKYSTQDRYFRIGAMAEGNGYNSEKNKYYNFSPIFKVSADFSKIEEVQWDTVEW
ncbi:MAG: DUF3823 domain-containing protein [Bacteroidales bacterium]|nr:DUF3823 domain-containing protein [Bacteroidales bacterium]